MQTGALRIQGIEMKLVVARRNDSSSSTIAITGTFDKLASPGDECDGDPAARTANFTSQTVSGCQCVNAADVASFPGRHRPACILPLCGSCSARCARYFAAVRQFCSLDLFCRAHCERREPERLAFAPGFIMGFPKRLIGASQGSFRNGTTRLGAFG